MTQILVGSELVYEVQQPTTFLFKITTGKTSQQDVIRDELNFQPPLQVEHRQLPEDGNRLHRVVVQPCELEVHYEATVESNPELDRPSEVRESNVSEIPLEVLTYMNPSRYCESDVLGRFATEEFGDLPRGYSRVQAVCDWVEDHLDYTLGSTGPTTTATDVLLQRTGVCRDYAHLMITLCRGLGIPARYVSGYAVNLQPPDFHGFVEVFLDGHWYLFDPTRLALPRGLVKIAIGRDAADVAFATFTGSAELRSKKVWAEFGQNTPSLDGSPAVSVS